MCIYTLLNPLNTQQWRSLVAVGVQEFALLLANLGFISLIPNYKVKYLHV